ncbi:MAG: hypothetical protein WC523_06215 [Patescibacteria group bacterium]|jgi:hypothetical protein
MAKENSGKENQIFSILKKMFGGDGKPGANKSWGNDLKQLFIEFGIPELIKILIDKVPDLTYEKFVSNYQKIWDVALPAFSFSVLRAFNAPDIVDEITTEILASAKIALGERTKDMKEGRNSKPAGTENISRGPSSPLIRDLIGLIGDPDLPKFLNLINVLEEDQKNVLLNTSLRLPQADAISILRNVAKLEVEPFKLWVDAVAPKPKPKPPREDTKFEKKMKEELGSFTNDLKSFLEKPTWLEKLADRQNH